MTDQFVGTRSNAEYDTSVEADIGIALSAPNMRARLLEAYVATGESGLTDDEAAQMAGVLDTCYWKRCNELRQLGLIKNTGRKRKGLSNMNRMVCVVVS
jgi:hypothetical protein